MAAVSGVLSNDGVFTWLKEVILSPYEGLCVHICPKGDRCGIVLAKF